MVEQGFGSCLKATEPGEHTIKSSVYIGLCLLMCTLWKVGAREANAYDVHIICCALNDVMKLDGNSG